MPKGKKSSTTSAVVTAQTQTPGISLSPLAQLNPANSVGVGAPTVSQPNPEGLALAINQTLTVNGLKGSASSIIYALAQSVVEKRDLALYHNKKNGWVAKETTIATISTILTACINRSGVYTTVNVDPSQVDAFRMKVAQADQLVATAKPTPLASLEAQFNTNLKEVVKNHQLLAKAIG